MSRLDQDDSYFKMLSLELKEKRDRVAKVLVDIGLKPIIPDGGYFMVADASNMSKFLMLCDVLFEFVDLKLFHF